VSKRFINSSYKGKRQHNNGNKALSALDGGPYTRLTPTLHARHTLSTKVPQNKTIQTKTITAQMLFAVIVKIC